MDLHANFATSLIATAPSPAISGTSLGITAGTGARFPAGTFNAVVGPAGATPEELAADHEIIRCTTRVTDNFTSIARAQEGTSARAIAVGDQIFLSATAKLFTDIEDAITSAAFTVGDSLTLTGSVLDTIQDLRISATPTFAGLILEGDASSIVDADRNIGCWMNFNAVTAPYPELIGWRLDTFGADGEDYATISGCYFNVYSPDGDADVDELYMIFASCNHGGAGTVNLMGSILAGVNIEPAPGGLVNTAYTFKALATSGAVEGANYAYYSEEQLAGAHNYYSWFNSRGVFRIREDSTFNAVGQAIAALYNPQFTKYTPGATDHERIVLGQWNSNVAEIGTEQGGTGVLRSLRLLGASVLLASDDAYGVGWNGSLAIPTKNAIYDKIESVISGSVTSITGTSNQVVASSGTGAVTLSLPQSIATSSTPQFAKLGLGASPTYALHIAPTSGVTAAQTVFIQDATATTGKTKVIIKAGAGDAANSDHLLSILNNAGAEVAYFRPDGLLSGVYMVTADNVALGIAQAASSGVNVGVNIANLGFIAWAQSNSWFATKDVGLYRNAAGVLEVNNGTAGTYRDLMVRSLLATTSAVPSVSDGAALGTTSLMWSDLFLASGAVINWNNGGMVLTHAANKLTLQNPTASTGVTTLVVKNGAGQSTTNLMEWQNSSGTVITAIDGTGRIKGVDADSGSVFGGSVLMVESYLKAAGIFAVGDSGNNNRVVIEGAVSLKAVFGSTWLIGWSNLDSTSAGNLRDGMDTAFYRNTAGVVEINSGTAGTFRDLKLRNVVGQTGYTEMVEMTAPAAGATNSLRLYAEDSGGKTRLMILFPTGVAQQLAIEA